MAQKAKKSKAEKVRVRMVKPKRVKDVPVTKGMLDAFDAKISKRMTSIELLGKAHGKRFDAIDSRFEAIDARFDSIDKRFEAIDKRFEAKMDSKFEMVMSAIHQQTVLMEEQNEILQFPIL